MIWLFLPILQLGRVKKVSLGEVATWEDDKTLEKLLVSERVWKFETWERKEEQFLLLFVFGGRFEAGDKAFSSACVAMDEMNTR